MVDRPVIARHSMRRILFELFSRGCEHYRSTRLHVEMRAQLRMHVHAECLCSGADVDACETHVMRVSRHSSTLSHRLIQFYT